MWKKTQINYYFQINYKCKFQIHCFYNGLNGLGTLYRDNHAHLFLSKEAILNEALKMFISSETKAAIGQGQRSCSDFPCSIHFHCTSAHRLIKCHCTVEQPYLVHKLSVKGKVIILIKIKKMLHLYIQGSISTWLAVSMVDRRLHPL